MKESTDIIPAELAALFDTLAYEENGGFTIEQIQFIEQDIHLDFTASVWDWETEINHTQHWQLQVIDYQGITISTDRRRLYPGGRFYFYSDHLRLWPFSTNRIDIYTKKPPKDYQKLLAGFYEYHRTALQNFISPEAFAHDLLAVSQQPYGLFASGPAKVLLHYFDILTEAGAEPYYYPPVPDNVLPAPPPDTYNGLKLAVLEGSSFIAPDFAFIRRE